MLQKEIVVGNEYLTRIGGQLARVVVLAAVERGSRAGYGAADGPKTLTRFRIARVVDGAPAEPLPKVRTAAALHRPQFTRGEIEVIRAAKNAPGAQPGDANNALCAYRFLLAVGCPS